MSDKLSIKSDNGRSSEEPYRKAGKKYSRTGTRKINQGYHTVNQKEAVGTPVRSTSILHKPEATVGGIPTNSSIPTLAPIQIDSGSEDEIAGVTMIGGIGSLVVDGRGTLEDETEEYAREERFRRFEADKARLENIAKSSVSASIQVDSDSGDAHVPKSTSGRVKYRYEEEWRSRANDGSNGNRSVREKNTQLSRVSILEALPGPQDGTAMKQLLERIHVQKLIQEEKHKADQLQIELHDTKRVKSSVLVEAHRISPEGSEAHEGSRLVEDKQGSKQQPSIITGYSWVCVACCKRVPLVNKKSHINSILHKNKVKLRRLIRKDFSS